MQSYCLGKLLRWKCAHIIMDGVMRINKFEIINLYNLLLNTRTNFQAYN